MCLNHFTFIILLFSFAKIALSASHAAGHSHLHRAHSAFASNHSLSRRQTSSNTHPDYTCGPDRPCENEACCGKSNICGYGPLYCGDGCQSNCDAVAECGQYAKEPGATCRLNVCCSEFGFCGTTSDFCDTGCQSNCGQPSKPGSTGKDVRNNVIGYWESWRTSGVPCGSMGPEIIPVEALDQLNLAFIYIDPDDYTLMPMDGASSVTDLYARVANTKLRNPGLRTWISIGGWSFNDKGPYQSVFGKIAEDSRLSAEFAKKCVEFMDEYGFDGVDIDWEYPGASDRGGTFADIINFPRMLAILQDRFKNSGGKQFGLTITVPTSYWYLRWFDLGPISKHIDGFNLMTYDLHGTWDRTDPIGPYVYAHTNLTEIDVALDLFWRNSIESSRINMGIGFYGRTFKLADPHCDTPGCEFSGPGDQGACTETPGILSYREIDKLLTDEGGYDFATYDENAGVYYYTYGKGSGDSWVSFDGPISFQDKVDLANSRGLGGLFIWAVDQDNANLDALRAVTGRDVVVPALPSGGFGGFKLDQCYITDCGTHCKPEDTTMTHLNEDQSGRGCDGKNHNQRSFCCPPRDAPDPDTCYWTGGPTNCHGQCKANEVAMALDDWGDSKKRCTNGGKKAWCCPATNGQSAIQKCGLVDGRNCPSDRPQDLTYVFDIINGLVDKERHYKSFCCPAEPVFNNCNWAGDNYYCNNNTCPLGKVELFRRNGYHGGPPKEAEPCNKGRQQAFCCDPPFTDGSPFLPVPLENLFPDAKDFPSSYDPVFGEAFDDSRDLTPESESGQDPNERSFAWIIMVGATADVQSFEKRDGSHLELFDCPSASSEDFSVQKVRAICTSTSEENNCEDILEGSVEGTVVRMPDGCGPDQWVRAVSFEQSTNMTLPHHFSKRGLNNGNKIYDFHYDWNFHQLRRDGGEVHVRVDASNHPGYWDEVVARPAGSPIKRDANTWRDIDRRSYAENDPSDWKKRFDNLLNKGGVGLKKHYEFSQCLFEASATCANFDAAARADISGEFDTTMDFGVSLIGTLRNFGFSEAFSYFRQEAFRARIKAGLMAHAKLEFDSGFHPVGSFDTFGSNYAIKGILTINPYFSAEARAQAQTSISAVATGELTLTHPRFHYYMPTDLGSLPTEPSGSFEVSSRNGPVSALGEISAKTGGDVLISLKPTIGFDISIAFGGKKLADTSIRLTSQADTDFGVHATVGSNCNGLQLDMQGQFQTHLEVENALPGWKSGTYEILRPTPKQIFSDCIPWAPSGKRDAPLNETSTPDEQHSQLLPRASNGNRLPSPEDTGTCAFSIRGIGCPGDDPQNDPEPSCNINNLPDPNVGDQGNMKRDGLDYLESTLLQRFESEISNSSISDFRARLERRAEMELSARSIGKRARPDRKVYCSGMGSGHFETVDLEGVDMDSEGSAIKYPTYPSSSVLARKRPDAIAFDFDDLTDCNNFAIARRKASAVSTRTREFATEHVMETQMFPNFMNYAARLFSDLNDDHKPSHPGFSNGEARTFPDPQMGGDAQDTPWCPYMTQWWSAMDASANNQVANSYPSTATNTEEFFLLHMKMNSNVKQNWFTWVTLAWSDYIDDWIKERKWSMAVTACKAHIVTWKYLLDPDVQTVLTAQVDRLAKRLETVENDFIPNTVRPLKDANGNSIFKQDYEYQGLADLWRDFVRTEHFLVQRRVRTFLSETATKLVNSNTKALQGTAALVETMENLQNEVNSLPDWNIPWGSPNRPQ